MLLPLGALGCGEEDNSVTYDDDIKPLFNRRCTTCHRPGGPSGVDIQNPFAPDTGLVESKNLWKEGHPEIDSPEFLVVPGEPDNSFLIHKISDPSLGLLPEENAGEPMPLQIPPVTAEELEYLEQWVTDGALNDDFYESYIVPIFGKGTPTNTGKCSHCHYPDAPNPPDLTNPFDEQQGVVNVKALYRADMDRVEPGDPDRSLLILKVRLAPDAADSAVGAPMPFSYEPLSDRAVETVRQWILEGAKP